MATPVIRVGLIGCGTVGGAGGRATASAALADTVVAARALALTA